MSLSVGVSAAACEWHSGNGGPFQSRWASYIADQTPMDDESSYQGEDGYAPPLPAAKKKPIFSKAASSASNIAKARVERRAKAEVKKAEASAKDDAPVTTTVSR